MLPDRTPGARPTGIGHHVPVPLSPLSKVNDPDRLRDLLEAVLGISSDLSLPRVLRRIVEAAVQVIGAKYGALGVLAEGGHGLSEFVNVGISNEDARAIGHLPEGHGILGLLIVDPRPLRLPDLNSHPDSYGFPPHHPPMRSFLGVPILLRHQVFGNLYLTEKITTAEFSDDDEALAVALAGAAGVAIENARLHNQVQNLSLVQDRERIAADLHDTVIQRIFATGLALQATLRSVTNPDVAQRIEMAVSDLDETIRQIRSTIFALHAPRVAGRGLREEILALATESAASLGFEPHLALDGPIDTMVDLEVAGHLLAVLREALSNVVRHAQASRVDVTVKVANGLITAEVRDNGVGPDIGARPGGQGLTNLAQRAADLGGDTYLMPAADGRGSVLSWQVPLSSQAGDSGAIPAR
jgi:signal transduction histidine kinase